MYIFSYDTGEKQAAGLRMSIVGRGSWHPAPDASFPGDEEGYGVFGVGNYCVEGVDVRASPATSDGVLVGDETWFMTAAACVKYRGGPDVLHCSAKGRPATR